MSDKREQLIAIDLINRGVSVKYNSGKGSYVATTIEGTDIGTGNEYTKHLAHALLDKDEKLKDKIDSLVAGETVKILTEKKGNYVNIKNIIKKGEEGYDVSLVSQGSSSSTGSSSGPSVSSVQGMIKGNAITNGVSLAIAQGFFSEEQITEEVKKVLSIHKAIEAISLSQTETVAEVVGEGTVEELDANSPKEAAKSF